MVADNLAMPAQLHWPGQPYKKGLIHACTFEIGNGPTGRLIPEWLLATAPPGHDRERMQADLREAVEPAAPHRCLDARPRSQEGSPLATRPDPAEGTLSASPTQVVVSTDSISPQMA